MSDKFGSLALPVDVPARLVLKHPYTGAPVTDAEGNEAYIELLSGDSRAAHDVARKQQARRNARQFALPPEDQTEEQEANLAETYAALTKDWRLIGLDGSPTDVPCTEENARELYRADGMLWIFEQVVAFTARRANFAKASSTR